MLQRSSKSKASLRSSASIKTISRKSAHELMPPLDQLIIKIKNVRLSDIDIKEHMIKVTFFDQIILHDNIMPSGKNDMIPDQRIMASGFMNYDPSDYEKMCLLADNPLLVQILPVHALKNNATMSTESISDKFTSASDWGLFEEIAVEVYCCNIDIMPIFIDQDNLCARKHMQPLIKPPVSRQMSWCNLPFITVEVSVQRHRENYLHHDLLKTSNFMKITLVGAYNVEEPFCAVDDHYVYTAASTTPLSNAENKGVVIFSRGYPKPKKFDNMSFYPLWENTRTYSNNNFSDGDEKLVYSYSDFTKVEVDDLEKCLNNSFNDVIWASFHRTLLMGTTVNWFQEFICKYDWPLEIQQMSRMYIGYSFVAYLDLSRLLFPGEHTVLLAMPLFLVDEKTVIEKCGGEPLLASVSKQMNAPVSSTVASSKTSATKVTGQITTSIDNESEKATSFVIVQVKLGRPLKKVCIPKPISNNEMQEMLSKLENNIWNRVCTARGQLDKNWENTVRMALHALRKVPYYGITEFCAFYRQLSETSTRVELLTSFWQEAAIYINNNFVVSQYLESDEAFEEMITIAHICLTKLASNTLVGTEKVVLDPVLRAARHAKQMQDIPHAADRYNEYLSQNENNADAWRELSTCLKDIDCNFAEVCLRRTLYTNPRDPLALLSMGCLVYDEKPEEAEIFFQAILNLYPFWAPGWVTINAYYIDQQLFHMADKVMELIKKTNSDEMLQPIGGLPSWECELGDWWDPAPLLPGICRYYEAADLLLRLRAVSLAEICIARALSESGDSAIYHHMVAMCCRLRGNTDDALCHLKTGIKKFGEVNYLRSLEAECYHVIGNLDAAAESFQKAGGCTTPYCNMLSLSNYEATRKRTFIIDLVRRQPNAYAWLTLAETWLTSSELSVAYSSVSIFEENPNSAVTNAIACATQALIYDRRAGRAWALLSRLVKPSARQKFYEKMMIASGFRFRNYRERQSGYEDDCFTIGTSIRNCQCQMCSHISVN